MILKKSIILIFIITILIVSQNTIALSTYNQNNYKKTNETIYYVDDEPGNGPDNPFEDFINIQDAIDASNDGDTIFVYNGTYKEILNVNKSINLIGENKCFTIIDGERKDDTITIRASNVHIQGFLVINAILDSRSAGILVLGQQAHISNCKVQLNGCGFRIGVTKDTIIDNCSISYNSGIGIFIIESSNTTIRDCNIVKNNRGIDFLNIDAESISNAIIENCSIYNNNAVGIYISPGHQNIVINNNLIFNHSGRGIHVWNASAIISNNHILENGESSTFDSGIYLSDCDSSIHIENNTISENKNIGLYLLRSFGNTIKNNDFMDNKRHIYFRSDDKILAKNTYINNYYDDLKVSWMKIIFGLYEGKDIVLIMPIINIELNPAKIPNFAPFTN